MKRITINRILALAGILAAATGVYFLVWWNQEIIVFGDKTPTETPGQIGPLTGLPCPAIKRPVAVMLASDPVTRPLSGIGQADIVVEMPVTPGPNSVTRMMAIFQCTEPLEIGSVRSARESFIPLAASFSALYAHWGGEYDALTQLNTGIVHNIDALKFEGSTFYRKTGIPRPHNGFTTIDLLRERADKLSYDTSSSTVTYPFTGTRKRNVANLVETITIPYDKPYDVLWKFDRSTKVYQRYRGGTPEMDKNTSLQVTAANVIVMKTTATPLRDQYLTVRISGKGSATIYQEGTSMEATWVKDPANITNPLQFLDEKGTPIPLVAGSTWIEVIVE